MLISFSAFLHSAKPNNHVSISRSNISIYKKENTCNKTATTTTSSSLQCKFRFQQQPHQAIQLCKRWNMHGYGFMIEIWYIDIIGNRYTVSTRLCPWLALYGNFLFRPSPLCQAQHQPCIDIEIKHFDILKNTIDTLYEPHDFVWPLIGSLCKFSLDPT